MGEVFGPDCKATFMVDEDGPGNEPAENCFNAQDDVAKNCFGSVKFVCPSRGYHGACGSYHYCSPDGNGGYTDKEYKCPAGQVFSDLHKTCLNINKVPECF